MVKICNDSYNNDKYDEFFKKFEFNLSDFQKYAIEGIVSNNHVLVTAHTGSGKTLPAEFAIEYFCNKGKKVIYTSPIKALSNQKYYEFSKKFPNISFGILTGDIKFNPEADVLIMTTEILQNTLHKKKSKTSADVLQFDMDIDNELSCVIFDEIHYINDQHRGKVWETSILLLPPHVQLVMLSATIHNSEVFAKWCEDRYDDNKEVYLASTEHRVVPLKHYYYTTVNEYLFKILKDKDKEKEIRGFVDKLHLIKNKDFNNDLYETNKKLLDLFDMKNCFIKPQFVLNKLIKYLYDEEMLPALCFVFSRKNVERFANDITVNLFGYDDAHVPSIIQKECEKIIRKLPNYDEYLNLPEYINMIKLLEKGIGIHHSGVMPVLREMVELLFGKGYIKVLFATETFAVGINMPTKTVIFSGMNKFTEDGLRNIFPHEYTQMAGRAGRRGLDTEGHVIHLCNLFKLPQKEVYSRMTTNSPQVIDTESEIDCNLLLRLHSIGYNDTIGFIQKNILDTSIEEERKYYQKKLEETNKIVNDLSKIVISMDYENSLMTEYDTLLEKLPMTRKNLYKKTKSRIDEIEKNSPNIRKDIIQYQKYKKHNNELDKIKKYMKNLENYIPDVVDKIEDYLEEQNLLRKDELTLQGQIAANINESNCLIFSELIVSGSLNDLSSFEIAKFLSCFAEIKLPDCDRCHNYTLHTNSYKVSSCIDSFNKNLEKIHTYEDRNYVRLVDYTPIQYDLLYYMHMWYHEEEKKHCLEIIKEANRNGISLGEWIKAILKVTKMSKEICKAAALAEQYELALKLKEIPEKILKSVCINQSLYH